MDVCFNFGCVPVAASAGPMVCLDDQAAIMEAHDPRLSAALAECRSCRYWLSALIAEVGFWQHHNPGHDLPQRLALAIWPRPPHPRRGPTKGLQEPR